MKKFRNKRRNLLLATFFVVVGAFCGQFGITASLLPSKVEAEIPIGCPGSTLQGPASPDQLKHCPVCYQRQPANYVQLNPPIVTIVQNCAGEPNYILILQNIRGHGMDADTCYIIQSGVNGITNGDPFGSETCNAAEAARVDKGTPTNPDGTPTTTNPEGGGSSGGGGGSSGGSTGGSTTGDGSDAGAGAQTPEAEPTKTADPVKINDTRQKVRDACTSTQGCIDANPIFVIMSDALNFLSAVVGIVVIGSIILGGIQYSASHGDPGAVSKAKKRIVNAFLALIAYMFLYAFLQWLVPGGPF